MRKPMIAILAASMSMIVTLSVGLVSASTAQTTAPVAGPVMALSPSRILDTGSKPVAKLSTISVPVAGLGGVPATGVSAVFVNITVASAKAGGYLTAWPSGVGRGTTSTLNFSAGQTVANGTMVLLGYDGKIQIYNGSSGTVRIIVDVTGYVLNGTTTATASSTPITTTTPSSATTDAMFWFAGVHPASLYSQVVDVKQAIDYNILKTDGTVWAWVLDGSASPAEIPGLSGVKQIAGGLGPTYALKTDGTVWAWGNNESGQLGNNSTIDSSVPVQVQGLTGVTAISEGASTGSALKSDGTVWVWGRSAVNSSLVPIRVPILFNVISISQSISSFYAIRSNHTVWAMGSYTYFGDGIDNSQKKVSSPIQITNLTGSVAIAPGYAGGYALKSDHTIVSWGDNRQGQLGINGSGPLVSLSPYIVGGPLTGVTAIASAFNTGYALTSNGTVWTWGEGAGSEPAQVTGLSEPKSISAGKYTGYAIQTILRP